MTNPEIIKGQVEALLPKYFAAKEAAEQAKEYLDSIKEELKVIIESPKSVKTDWGTVTLVKGRRTVKITDRALNAQITFLKEEAVKDGRAAESHGESFIMVKEN